MPASEEPSGEEDEKATGKKKKETTPPRLPGILSQFGTLLARRWKIFFRDRTQVLLQVAILLCFPVLVTFFAERGKEPIKRLSDIPEENIVLELPAK